MRKAIFSKDAIHSVSDFSGKPEEFIIRVAPIPLYNSYEDVFRFSEIVAEFCNNC